MKLLQRLAVLAVASSLAACTTPNTAGPLTAEQKKSLHIAGITTGTVRQVMVDQAVLDRIAGRVRDEIRMASPNVLAAPAPGDPPPLTMRLVFTDYQGPNAVTQYARSNVGTIHIDADVQFIDQSGKTVALSKVSTHFGSGGDVGITTNILNVEVDFELAVAALVR